MTDFPHWHEREQKIDNDPEFWKRAYDRATRSYISMTKERNEYKARVKQLEAGMRDILKASDSLLRERQIIGNMKHIAKQTLEKTGVNDDT